MRCVRGHGLLSSHKLRVDSPTTRVLSACCHCSITARFDNWMPQVPLRSYAAARRQLRPEICIFTRSAPDPRALLHAVPRYRTVAPRFALQLALATVQNMFHA